MDGSSPSTLTQARSEPVPTARTEAAGPEQAGLQQRDLQLQALLAPGIKAILIKGRPGAGKTTAGLELLRMTGRGGYLATRVPANRLMEQFPELREFAAESTGPGSSAKASKIQVWDLRLALATQVVDHVRAAIRHEPLVVLDSWDAVAGELDTVERAKAERSLLNAVEDAESRLVFVTEELEPTPFDYVGDALVNLSDREFAGHRLRELEWSKLRGQPTTGRRALYSLWGGRFHLIPSLRVEATREPKRFVSIPHGNAHYSTGSADLDRFLGGGLRKGSFTLLEVGNTLGPDWHVPLTAAIACNFLLDGGCVFAVPSAGGADTELKMLAAHLDAGMVESSVRIGTYEEEEAAHPSFIRLPRHPEDLIKIVLAAAREFKADRPCCMSLSIEAVELRAGPRAAIQLVLDSLARLRTSGDIALAIVKPGSDTIQTLSNICDLHLCLEEVNGCLLVYGKRPPTSLFAVTYDYSHGYPLVGLIPML